ncbi:Asp23/Gls24 family envelope stress response protein [Rathayibacter sp. SD072]|uniref:Asp23/Gls24 family envelope stress response protein n=1 Tax=Rathayibacter sp. SD072 TaxID=2781731 RepID=UPI001A96D79E|nr:Asp23/Gls24 family envelope stress response protein [Rathayibacter sp. SD072]MBO0983792.1 Asp23/Gls24 family envelope stress response protein [Rathayibacter sp. SD072]
MAATPTTADPIVSTTAIGGELGTTTIDQDVVATVAGLAASEVTGVHELGGAATRVLGAVRGALNTVNHHQGVTVAVTEQTVGIDVTFTAEYPMSLQKVASDVRSAIILAVETIVGLEVTAVNVRINDIVLPREETTETAV